LVIQYVLKRRRQNEAALEDVLKQAVKQKEQAELSVASLAQKLALSPRLTAVRIRRLQQKGLMELKGADFDLTLAGKRRAYELIRAHRLWETYLVQEMGLSADQIHTQAEAYEHRLPEKFLREVEQQLGYPKFDPHGSPIPQSNRETTVLSKLALGQRALVVTEQLNDAITTRLWKLGINPNSVLELDANDATQTTVLVQGQPVRLEADFAGKVLVVLV
jgi:Mn-dependent DtxR family transcriptional regulator